MPRLNIMRPAEVWLSLDAQQLALVDSTAERRGQGHAAFVLDAAMRDAAEPLDQTTFFLSDENCDRFKVSLEAHLRSNEALRDLLHSKAPWTA